MASKFLVGIRKYLSSSYFVLTVFLLACAVSVVGAEVAGAIVFAFIIVLTFILTDDILATTPTFLFLSAFAVKCFGSFDTFINFWWVVFPVVFSVIFHILVYRRKIQWGDNFIGIIAVTVAVSLGGIGIISPNEYFSGVSLFYSAGLGAGMIAVYIALAAYLKSDCASELSRRIPVIMTYLCALCCVMIAWHYISNIDTVLETKKILDFQWRNNISSLLMLSLPFPFYLAQRKTPYILIGYLGYLFILISGSRGGMVFGSIEFLLCLVMSMRLDKKRRRSNIIICACAAVVVLAFSRELFAFISKTVNRFFMYSENEIRLGLLERAVEDFKSNPVFGRGLGYFGNRDIHKSAKFALCWYHSSPFQIIGSFGLTGVVCYGFQYAVRLRTFVKNVDYFTCTVFLSWLGIEMMSLVNPGVFSPIPYLVIVTMFFVILEKYGANKITPLFKKAKG